MPATLLRNLPTQIFRHAFPLRPGAHARGYVRVLWTFGCEPGEGPVVLGDLSEDGHSTTVHAWSPVREGRTAISARNELYWLTELRSSQTLSARFPVPFSFDLSQFARAC